MEGPFGPTQQQDKSDWDQDDRNNGEHPADHFTPQRVRVTIVDDGRVGSQGKDQDGLAKKK